MSRLFEMLRAGAIGLLVVAAFIASAVAILPPPV